MCSMQSKHRVIVFVQKMMYVLDSENIRGGGTI
jgi:hypothetical protein